MTAQPLTREPVCSLVGVTKSYGGVRALDGVDLEVHPGRVHAIVGENGAGKSTLMKVLAGVERPDQGEVCVRGRRVRLSSVREANEHGIAIVFQELRLFPQLDVLSNLFLLRQPGRFGIISRAEMRRRAQPVLEEIGLNVSVDARVADLPLDEQQLLEFARALLERSDVLILDEPNSALNAAESERLFAVIRKLRDRGVAVIYISHRLEEVFALADELTVMRNGRVVARTDPKNTTIPEVVAAMIGREPSELNESTGSGVELQGTPLRFDAVTVGDRALDVTFAAWPGEILGLAGLEGSGHTAVFDVLFGAQAPASGKVTLPNGGSQPRSIRAAVAAGVAYVPGDRRNVGLMLDRSVGDNLVQVSAGTLGRDGFFLRRGKLDRQARERIASLDIKAGSLHAAVRRLSGGNQQKVVLGKWLDADPRVVLLDDPTRGVDVGAKGEIYRIVRGLADEGRYVLFTSGEQQEFVRLCDRVLVFFRGRICAEFDRGSLDEGRLLEAMNTGRS
jgi:ABC-type sugar transport system ATPase subunit